MMKQNAIFINGHLFFFSLNHMKHIINNENKRK